MATGYPEKAQKQKSKLMGTIYFYNPFVMGEGVGGERKYFIDLNPTVHKYPAY